MEYHRMSPFSLVHSLVTPKQLFPHTRSAGKRQCANLRSPAGLGHGFSHVPQTHSQPWPNKYMYMRPVWSKPFSPTTPIKTPTDSCIFKSQTCHVRFPEAVLDFSWKHIWSLLNKFALIGPAKKNTFGAHLRQCDDFQLLRFNTESWGPPQVLWGNSDRLTFFSLNHNYTTWYLPVQL